MVVPMRKISSVLPDISISAITTATSVMTLFLAQLIKNQKPTKQTNKTKNPTPPHPHQKKKKIHPKKTNQTKPKKIQIKNLNTTAKEKHKSIKYISELTVTFEKRFC